MKEYDVIKTIEDKDTLRQKIEETNKEKEVLESDILTKRESFEEDKRFLLGEVS